MVGRVSDATRRVDLQGSGERITLRSPVASLNISGGVAMAATFVVPGKQSNSLSTLWRASPVYDPAENPRTSMSLMPSGMEAVTRWGKHARTNSSLPCGW